MSRRVKLPGASELFRPTGAEPPTKKSKAERTAGARPAAPTEPSPGSPPAEPSPSPRSATIEQDVVAPGGSGRVRHEEKITVYVSRDELLALEQARLRLRGELGLAVDRGRLVRAAVSLALADLEAAGEDGELVRRLTAP